MSAGSAKIGPVSIIPLPTERSRRQQDQQSPVIEPGLGGDPDECQWRPSEAAKAAECAEEMRRRIAEKLRSWASPTMFPGDECLAPPILDRHLGDLPSHFLLSWVYFDPFRPIVSTLWYVELPGSAEGLLTFFKDTKDTALHTQNAVFGVIPGAYNGAAIARAALALFAANGHESCVITDGLPSSIGHNKNWPAMSGPPEFGPVLAKALFRYPAARCWSHTAMRVCCEHLRHYPDPWERVGAGIEFRRSVNAGTEYPHLTEFNEKEYGDWFELVTNPDHVDAERLNVGSAKHHALFVHKEPTASVGTPQNETLNPAATSETTGKPTQQERVIDDGLLPPDDPVYSEGWMITLGGLRGQTKAPASSTPEQKPNDQDQQEKES